MKVIFMGTPEFSVGTLKALIEAGHEVVLAVTQPDKPKGRGGRMQYPPVKEMALEYGIPVFQPKKIRAPECVEELRKYEADIMVVIAFGQILPKEILEMTPYGCVNVHASLLPKYRVKEFLQVLVIGTIMTRQVVLLFPRISVRNVTAVMGGDKVHSTIDFHRVGIIENRHAPA